MGDAQGAQPRKAPLQHMSRRRLLSMGVLRCMCLAHAETFGSMYHANEQPLHTGA
jgi:hypothetical protein